MAQDFLEPGFIDAGLELKRLPVPASMTTRKEALFGFDVQDRPVRIIDGYAVGSASECLCFSAGLKPKAATILRIKSRWLMVGGLAGNTFSLSYQRQIDGTETPWATFVATGPVWQELELTIPLDDIAAGQEVIFNLVVTGAVITGSDDLIYMICSSTGSVRGYWG
ncbi:MAG: hypothetical protein ABFD91_02300 [Anaerohalosphaeraceae bacterium]